MNDDDRAISCDQCEKWQHLSCDTGISLRQYRKMMLGAEVEVVPERSFFCFSRVAGDTAIGCVFHWNQRVYRKVVNERLATAYGANGDKFLFLRKLMSLPYLPSEHIIPAFEQMMVQAEERPWIRGSMWKPENWGVYRQTVGTNNDVEGMAHRTVYE
ncbi:hypothetical protein DPMN_172282 [Dreissena polymorpha]|uniref:Uncharacterized protein n=1 Tax=Dreissena polymorpha TaxID=45954 RepID=A0A9D4DZJ2_DREPO|nr:hypothetical protein DPMN_172282 [Dreissena polymorpha]